MKLLINSAGIGNTSIRSALVDLLGKPSAESSALFVPTAIYAIPVPSYAIDDNTAIKVTDSKIEVISEGRW